MADELSDERSECGDSDSPEDGDGDTTLTAHHKSDWHCQLSKLQFNIDLFQAAKFNYNNCPTLNIVNIEWEYFLPFKTVPYETSEKKNGLNHY
jgi:hypothetical protein